MTGRSPEWASVELGTQRLIRDTVEFFANKADWNVWGTLTYADFVTFEQSQKDLRCYLRHVAKNIIGEHVPAFWATDPQHRGVPHHHLLLQLPDRLDSALTRTLRATWLTTHPRAGFSRFSRVRDPHRRIYYAVATHGYWDFNVACSRRPRCRRSTCIVAPGPW